MIPFRLATLHRKDIIDQAAIIPGATEFTYDRVLPGTGYMADIDLFCSLTSAGNGAGVTVPEDSAYNALSSVILSDVTGQIINMDGWGLKWLGRYGGWEPFSTAASADAVYVEQAPVAGAGATGGSFLFHTHVPEILNRRDLVGLLGNQDRSQQYTLRTNVNTAANIYTVAPTNVATQALNIVRNYHSYAVPNATNDSGQAQQVLPPTYGTISYLTRSTSPSPPTGGGQVNHYLSRVGNAIRVLMLVWRLNGSRTNANPVAAFPSNLQVKIGDQVIYNEGPATRRRDMWERYGFDAPLGTLVYENIQDFGQVAGSELYHDWWWTENVVQAQINATYPAGMGAVNNSLVVYTSDVIVPPGVNIYQPL